ncbi:MAG: hypothetical protein O9296_15995 [Novosphingobium sp.]|nr:hypothetical protein [Novosphingobium sp.]
MKHYVATGLIALCLGGTARADNAEQLLVNGALAMAGQQHCNYRLTASADSAIEKMFDLRFGEGSGALMRALRLAGDVWQGYSAEERRERCRSIRRTLGDMIEQGRR